MVSILIILYSFLFPQTRSEFGAEVNVFTALDVRPGTFRYFHSPGMNFHPCFATGDWTLQTRGDCEMVDWEDNIGYCCLGSNGDGFISLLTGSGEHLASMQHYWRGERRGNTQGWGFIFSSEPHRSQTHQWKVFDTKVFTISPPSINYHWSSVSGIHSDL